MINKFNKISLSILLILVIFPLINASCSRIGSTFINNQGNYTVNESSGYIISIKTNQGDEILNGNNLGASFQANGSVTFGSGNAPFYIVPVTFSVNITTNTSNSMIVKLNNTGANRNYNLTYYYNCYDNSFDIITTIIKTDGSPVVLDNYSNFILRYEFPLKNTTLTNNNYNVTPNSATNFVNYSAYPISSTTTGGAVGSPDSVYFSNGTTKFLIQSKNLDGRPTGAGQTNNWVMNNNFNQPLSYQQQPLFFNGTYNTTNYSFSIVLNQNYERSKLYAFNTTYSNNTNMQGPWVSRCSDLTTVTDATLQGFYNGGARWVHLHCWFPYYGYYPTSGNWITKEGETMNVTFLNSLINRMNSIGLKVFLYIDPVEMEYTNATASYESSIVKNSSLNYSIAYWDGADPTAQTYLMSVDNTPFMLNMTTTVSNILTNYSNITGIFIDRGDYHVLDYAHGFDSVDTTLNYTVGFYQRAYDRFLNNITTQIHNAGKLVNLNIARGVNLNKYVDFITYDAGVDYATTLPNMRLSSLGKYYYTSANTGGGNDELATNISLLWGTYYYYYGTTRTEINYMINKVVNQELINWDNDYKRTIYPNIYGINKNYNLTHSSNTDWYNLYSHKFLAQNTLSYNYTQNSQYANLIYYNFTIDKGYYASDGISIKDNRSIEIDKVPWGSSLYDASGNRIRIGNGSVFNNVIIGTNQITII